MHRRLEFRTALHVIPHDLLIMCDDAGLFSGRAVLVDHDPSTPRTCRSQLFEEHPAAFIRTDDAAEVCFPPQGLDVIEDVRGATELQGLRINMDHRHRGFRRDAVHTAPDIVVENEVADHEHGGLRESRDVLPKHFRGRRTSAALSPGACRRVARGFVYWMALPNRSHLTHSVI